jgi:hypothetical protein
MNLQNKIFYKNYHDINPTLTIRGNSNDFKNPIEFFDKILSEKKETLGIVKIIPPREWRENYEKIFEKFYRKKLLEKDLKLDIRKQILSDLLLGKVNK